MIPQKFSEIFQIFEKEISDSLQQFQMSEWQGRSTNDIVRMTDDTLVRSTAESLQR